MRMLQDLSSSHFGISAEGFAADGGETFSDSCDGSLPPASCRRNYRQNENCCSKNQKTASFADFCDDQEDVIRANDYMLPRDELLKGVENRDCAVRVIDQAEQAIKTWDVVYTDFLSPPELADVQRMFSRLTEVQSLAWGGYPQAERQRLAIARSEIPLDESQVAIAAVDIAGNFLFDSASHRDFLGALLGTGIVRDKVGDIIVLGERGAQAVIVPELLEFLETSLTQVRSVPVKTRRIELTELKVREPKKKEITTVEASLRLDAIASAGFGMSRSKMADLINGGDVRVNWKDVSQASYQVKTGDLVAIRGKGRLEVGEVAITKKERYRVQLTRFM